MTTTEAPMMQGVQNPEIMFRSAPLPATMRFRLLELGYAPHAAKLLVSGLPIVYSQGGLVVEYPEGRRIQVRRHEVYDASGAFQRYRYEIVRELPAAAR
jgi:hypothetical protein